LVLAWVSIWVWGPFASGNNNNNNKNNDKVDLLLKGIECPLGNNLFVGHHRA